MVNKNIKRCVHCGTSLIQLQTTHRVGCSFCYETFKGEINSILGDRMPLYEGEDRQNHFHEQLRFRLDQALFKEEYELAARLRDELAGIGTDENSGEE